jgi:hypothetical protein
LENVNFYWWSVYSFKFCVPRQANKSGSLPKKQKDFGICIKPTIGTSNIEKKMLGQDWEPCGMDH